MSICSQVVIQEIELLGVPERSVDLMPPRRATADILSRPSDLEDTSATCRTETSADEPKGYDEELNDALLKAGVPLDIVARVLRLPSEVRDGESPAMSNTRCEPPGRSDEATTHSTDQGVDLDRPTPQAGEADNRQRTSLHEHQSSSSRSNLSSSALQQQHECSMSGAEGASNSSVFDTAIHEELSIMRRHDELFNEIVRRDGFVVDSSLSAMCSATRCVEPSSTTSSMLGLLPTISATDRGNLLEIVMYTFGNLSCECLCCDVPELRALAVVTAERFSAMLRDAMGVVITFEGAIALLRISLQDPDQHVFRATLHFAQTVFQQRGVIETDTVGSSLHTDTGTLGLIDEIAGGRVNQALRLVMEALLMNPCCSTTPAMAHSSTAGKHRLALPGKRKINPDLVKFVRMLLAQDRTELGFYRALLPGAASNQRNRGYGELRSQELKSCVGYEANNNHGDESNWVEHANRLRLIRLLLHRHDSEVLRVPQQVSVAMKSYCSSPLFQNLVSQSPSTSTTYAATCWRLANDCLLMLSQLSNPVEIDIGTNHSLKPRLAAIHDSLENLKTTGEPMIFFKLNRTRCVALTDNPARTLPTSAAMHTQRSNRMCPCSDASDSHRSSVSGVVSRCTSTSARNSDHTLCTSTHSRKRASTATQSASARGTSSSAATWSGDPPIQFRSMTGSRRTRVRSSSIIVRELVELHKYRHHRFHHCYSWSRHRCRRYRRRSRPSEAHSRDGSRQPHQAQWFLSYQLLT